MFRVKFVNHFLYYLAFKSFFDALDCAKKTDFESRIDFDDNPVASWSSTTGLAFYEDHSFLTSKKAAFLLGVSQRRINQFCKEGRLGRKLGGRYIITWDELEKFASIPRPANRPKTRSKQK